MKIYLHSQWVTILCNCKKRVNVHLIASRMLAKKNEVIFYENSEQNLTEFFKKKKISRGKSYEADIKTSFIFGLINRIY